MVATVRLGPPAARHGARRVDGDSRRGDRLSKVLRPDRLLRLEVFPLAISLPWGIAPAAPPQLPLPVKIRTRFLPPVDLDHDPARAEDDKYADRKHHEVEDAVQDGMDALARKRALPLVA